MGFAAMTACLCDSNVWLALAVRGHSHHTTAESWFDDLTEGKNALFCRATQQSFLRLLTNAAVMTPHRHGALTNEEAWQAYDGLMGDDRVDFRPDEPEGLGPLWRRFTARPSASPKLWMDAYLAAFSVAAGLRLVTTDPAFRQFQGLDFLLLE